MLNPKPDSFYHPDQKIELGCPNPLYLKQAQLKQQSLYNGNSLLEKHDPPAVYDSKETLKLAQESCEKMRFLKKKIKPANYAKINHLSGVFVPQTTKSKKELFLSNVSNMVTIPKMISIPNEDLSDDTTPSVARKFQMRVDLVSNNQSIASIRTNPITNFQRHVTFKENMSSDMVNSSFTRLVHTARTRRPQPKGNTRNDRVPSASKSSEAKKNHMTGKIKLLISFLWKFLGTVRFGNDHIAVVLGYGDLKWGNITITRVYFVEGLGHNLLSIYVRLQAPVIIVRTDNRTEFKTHVLKEYFDSVGITHETSAAKNRRQNGVVERRNRTLVEAVITMLIFSHAPLFIWAEAIAIACHIQKHSIIH
nr:putative ribonuclease H-like domain-containing protein [Tanacetum cinerariifolium]